MARTTRWTDPADAVSIVAARMADLVRSLPGGGTEILGEWDALELATHVTQVFEFAAELAATGEAPLDDIFGLGDFTKDMVDQEPERDPQVLAERIEAAARRFAGNMSAAPPGGDIRWLGGIQLPLSALSGHLVSETLLHGVDLGRATGGAGRSSRPTRWWPFATSSSHSCSASNRRSSSPTGVGRRRPPSRCRRGGQGRSASTSATAPWPSARRPASRSTATSRPTLLPCCRWSSGG